MLAIFISLKSSLHYIGMFFNPQFACYLQKKLHLIDILVNPPPFPSLLAQHVHYYVLIFQAALSSD